MGLKVHGGQGVWEFAYKVGSGWTDFVTMGNPVIGIRNS